ncbi:hypothetical protein GCK72_008557 [Caenorhabditis remanei]|uniref:Sdz-33 F-box domain-containing protein n=1 Tax=Caenorhabditis remanei TaxID=31234 RepID=A0A6A5GXV5_CAERE|nr:hypothetical protein GCK72_008557 [Caenorhabditis remanei]KAF1760310.1 hypothetical protein GCK72_008557 [Caenorhabditis remanei]
MNPDGLLIFSLVSSKTKNLVTSLGLRASSVYIDITYDIGITVYIGRFGWILVFRNISNDENVEFDITRPISPSCLCLGKTFRLLSNWLDHIRNVFSCTEPLDVAFRPGSDRFGMESLKKMMKNVTCLTITAGVTDIQSKIILKSFKNYNELTLRINPFEESCEIRKFFIQNLKFFGFYDVYSLDDMLFVNSEQVYFRHPTTQKQFNQFTKHWIRGSNPRLRDMSLSIDNSVSRDVLLKGIHCVDVAEEKQEEICRKHKIVSDYMVEIRRSDGTPAAIATKDFNNVLHIRFFVFY